MSLTSFNARRRDLNGLMSKTDSFFEMFGKLDSEVYADGAIPKKYKELTGLAISLLSRCEECILYHLQECLAAGCSESELIEAIKMGVIGGGSITYPYARIAFSAMRDLDLVSQQK